MPDPTLLWLLDKNVVRRALNALARLDLKQPLDADDLATLELLRAIREEHVRGVISPELANILRRHTHQASVRVVLTVLPVFRPTRYFKRWARRLRDEGFTREDAKVIALGTFGRHEAETRFGADAILTDDVRLIHHYEQRIASIRRRLKAMTTQLPEPFHHALLPAIITPMEAVERKDQLGR